MTRPQLAIVSNLVPIPREIPFSEKLADHHAILQGYLDTCITRNHSVETVEFNTRFLNGWFEGLMVPDSTHPDGERQLLVWEAMAPVTGRERIQMFTKGLVTELRSPVTVRTYLGCLRRFFEYVLNWPYIPNTTGVTIPAKYGRIDQPVLKYDYPVHVLDPEQEGFPLTGEKLNQFFCFIREDYIRQNQKRNIASRDYTAIVIAGTSGLRASEISHLDALGIHRDLFYQEARIQTRFGKAANGSGKRVRKTIFTPFAQATVKAYEEHIRPKFSNSKTNPALFLAETGERISYQAMNTNFNKIVKAARKAGLDLPPRMGWHSLRKSFATDFVEQNPEQIWVLMDMLGHMGPSTLHRYVKHTRSYYENSIDKIIEKLTGDVNTA